MGLPESSRLTHGRVIHTGMTSRAQRELAVSAFSFPNSLGKIILSSNANIIYIYMRIYFFRVLQNVSVLRYSHHVQRFILLNY